ncbi:MAG: hypothetical protein IH905_12865 [Proteobacteria bacterium]|nr:hypothetical protein [Pseudomonadota bacterium]
MKYDLKNVTDLMRYLLPKPPVPVRWRRRMLALGSGDPTRGICSTMLSRSRSWKSRSVNEATFFRA